MPNFAARSAGEAGRRALVVPAGAVPTTACLVLGSHPRTVTALTCSAELRRGRNSSRSCPKTSCSGPEEARSPSLGASLDGCGFLKWSWPSVTATSNPISEARALRKSQSERLSCETWAWVMRESSIVPGCSPWSFATCRAMSEYFMFTNVFDMRPM